MFISIQTNLKSGMEGNNMTLTVFLVVTTPGLLMILAMSTLTLTPVLAVEDNSYQYPQIHQIRNPSISFDEDSNNLSLGEGNEGNHIVYVVMSKNVNSGLAEIKAIMISALDTLARYKLIKSWS